MRKPNFDKRWLTVLDPLCRKLASAIFAMYALKVVDGTKYGIDQVICHDDLVFGYLEVEYVDPKSGRFTHNCYHSPVEKGISIPIRKDKFFLRYTPSWWMNFSSDLSHCIILPGDVVMSGRISKYKPHNNEVAEEYRIVELDHPSATRWRIMDSLRHQTLMLFAHERPDLHHMMRSLPLLYN